MSFICNECGGIFNNPCITFNNNINKHHYQIDKYGILYPVFYNFLGIECWLNDNYDNHNYGTFTYQPTIKLLNKLHTIPQKTTIDIQIFKEITHFIDHKYIINLDYGIQLLNHQLSTNSINLHGHSTIFKGNIPIWISPIIYYINTNINTNTTLKPIKHIKPTKLYKSSFKLLLQTIDE